MEVSLSSGCERFSNVAILRTKISRCRKRAVNLAFSANLSNGTPLVVSGAIVLEILDLENSLHLGAIPADFTMVWIKWREMELSTGVL